MKPLVITHGSCDDGQTCAWLMSKHFGPDGADYLYCHYGDPVPDVTDRPAVYVLDFSWKRPQMAELIVRAKGRVVVLDHHATAEKELDGIEEEAFTISVKAFGRYLESRPHIKFDMTRCGAVLTWEYLREVNKFDRCSFDLFFAGQNGHMPELVKYVNDRDMWFWQMPHSKAVSAYIRSFPRTFEVWDTLHQELQGRESFHLAAHQGEAIMRNNARVVESHVRNAKRMTILGHDVPVVNATTLISEVGEALAVGQPFAATWFDDLKANVRRWSFRSRDGGVNVAEVAAQLGGGGHPAASGCSTPLTDPVYLTA